MGRLPPIDPVECGRLVTYRGSDDQPSGWIPRVCGCGWHSEDERERSTVRRCKWDHGYWSIDLLDGTAIGVRHILAVAKTDDAGLVLSAWSVREHGFDGAGR